MMHLIDNVRTHTSKRYQKTNGFLFVCFCKRRWRPNLLLRFYTPGNQRLFHSFVAVRFGKKCNYLI